MRLLTSLLTLLLTIPLGAAPAGGIFIATDTGGLNARPAYVTVTPLVGGTNLAAGSLVSTGKVTISSGDNFGIQATISAGQLMDIRRGTMTSPVLTSNGPAIRVTQTLEIPSSTTTGDGSDFAAALQGLSQGATNNGIQPIGVYGGAKSYSTNQTTSGADDALGGYFLGRSYGTGAGIGLTGYAMRETTNGFAHGMETVIFNNSGVSNDYLPTGVGRDVNILMAPGGTADSVAGIQMHMSRGVQWAHGIAIGGNTVSNRVGAIRDSSIRDDSHSLISLEINGKHTNAAIAIDNTSGYVLIGETTPSFTQQRLSVIASNGYSSDPLVFFGHPAHPSNYTAFIRNSAGTLRLGIVGTASFVITGAASGDGIITPSTGKALHLGGTTRVVSVNQANELGFFAATPVPQQANTVATRAALVNFGLLAPGVTIDPTPTVAPTVASATTIAPTTRITFISGAAAIDAITPPTGVASTGGTITLVATGAWTCTTSGNIASTFTAVANKAYQFAYDATTTKWYPPN